MVSVAELRLLISGKDDTNAAFKSAKGNVDSLEKSTGGLGSTLGGVAKIASGFVIGAGLTQLPNLISGLIGGASDLNENLSKVQTVFGDGSAAIEEFSKNAAQGMGLTKSEALAATGTLGNLFQAIGLGKEQMVNMSEGTVQLAGDLASFNNLSTDDALEKLRAGLVGEAEPLRSLGVNMNEAMVKAKGLELGLADAHGELSEGAKVQARYAIIMEQTTTAQGDFARTSSGNANQMRILKAEFGNLRDELGAKLLPVVVSTGKFMLEYVVPAMERASDVVSDLIEAGIDKIGGFLEEIRDPAQDVAEALISWGQNDAIPTIQAFGETLRDTIIPAITDFANTLKDKLQGPLEAVTGFLGGKDEVLKSLGIAIGIVTGAVIAWSVAQGVLNVLLAANPVGALILGLTLLVAGIVLVVRNWDDIVAKFPALGTAADGVKAALDVFIGWIKDPFIPAVQSIFDTVSKVIGDTVKFVIDNWHNIWDLALNPVMQIIITTFSIYWTIISGVVSGALTVIQGVFDVFKGIFTGDWDLAWEGIKTAFSGVWDSFKGIVTGVLDEIKKLFDGTAFQPYKDAIVGAFTTVKNAVVGVFTGIGGAIISGMTAAVNTVIGLINAVISAYNRIPILPDIGLIPLVGGGGSSAPAPSGPVYGPQQPVFGPEPPTYGPDVPVYGPTVPIPSMPGLNIPTFAAGGIVTRPTVALVGESGPEAIIPLSRAGGMQVHIHLEGAYITDIDGLVVRLERELRRRVA